VNPPKSKNVYKHPLKEKLSRAISFLKKTHTISVKPYKSIPITIILVAFLVWASHSFLFSAETHQNLSSPFTITSSSKRINIKESERGTKALSVGVFNEVLTKISELGDQGLKDKTKISELEMELKYTKEKLQNSKSTPLIKNALSFKSAKSTNLNQEIMQRDWGISTLIETLSKTAQERDLALSEVNKIKISNKELELNLALMEDQNDVIFSRLEDAMSLTISPLKSMFRSLGLPTENIITNIRNEYSGEGGPLDPASMTDDENYIYSHNLGVQAELLLKDINELSYYRILAERTPLAFPLKSSYRLTSNYGYRKDPKTGKKTMHSGTDFAAPKGTPVYATADGIVTYAGINGGYGKLITIKHAFGYETRYGHNSKFRVKRGQMVSQGDRIADVGSTGRSTGNHLHYEIRRYGKAKNPTNFIKAGRNVF
jgi:murein DD-endopeptidase MepM/ murein hydrolase activator NlpD